MRIPRLTALALSLLLALAGPVRAQEEAAPEIGVDVPEEPGGLKMGDLEAVSDRLKTLVEEKTELERTQPDDGESLKVLNTRIGILQDHQQFLRARKTAAESRVTVDDVEEARRQAKEAEAARESFDAPSAVSDLDRGWVEIETIRKRLDEQTAKVREAASGEERTGKRLRDLTAERERLPAQREATRAALRSAVERIERLDEREKEFRSREEYPQKEYNLVVAEQVARQQEARSLLMRLDFHESRAGHLDRAIERAVLLERAAADRLAQAEAREAAIRLLLDQRLAKQSLDLKGKIEDARVELEAETEEYERLRLKQKLENLRLEAALGSLRRQVADVEDRRRELEKLRREAAQSLESYEEAYAADAPPGARPDNEKVSAEIRRLAEATATAAYQAEIDRFKRIREEAEDRLADLRSRLADLDEEFDTIVARAKEAWDERTEAIEPGEPRPPAWELEEAAFRRARQTRREHLTATIGALENHLADLQAAIELRREIHDTRRQTLLLLRRENLFLRGRSLISWESFTKGLSDLTRLPAWAAGAAAGVGAYLLSPENRFALLTFLVLTGLVAGLLLWLRRKLVGRVRRHLREGDGDVTVRRARIVTLRLLVPLATSLAVLAVFLGAWLLLPEPVPTGVRHLLLSLGLLFAGFWFARALNRVLVRGRSEGGKVLPFENSTANRLGRGLSILLWLTVLLVPLELVLRSLGYGNEGALELLSLVYKVLVGIVVLVILLRRRNLLGLIPESESRLARLLRVVVTAIHPILVLLVPGLLLLDVLRYDILAGLIAGVAVNTVGFAVLGYLAYRGLTLVAERRMEVADVVDPRAPGSDRRDARQVVQFAIFLFSLLGTIWAILAFSGTSLSELRLFFSEPLPLQAPDAEDPATWWNLFVALFLLYLAFSVTRYLKKGLQVFVLGRTKMDRGLQYTIVTLFGYVLVTGGVVLAARQLFDLTNFGYVVAALSVGIGFGLQEIVSNFISGVILLFERSLKVGDMIEVGTTTGVVTRIQVRSTTVVTRDNVTITVPNRDFMTKNVVNYVGADAKMRLKVPFGVSYASDPERVRDVILEVAKEEPQVLSWPKPEVWFKGLGDSSLDFELLAWVRDPVERHRIQSELYYRIFAALGKAGIEIPFPQRDLHIRSPLPISLGDSDGPAPPAAPPEEE